jgi:hypothetical protein
VGLYGALWGCSGKTDADDLYRKVELEQKSKLAAGAAAAQQPVPLTGVKSG